MAAAILWQHERADGSLERRSRQGRRLELSGISGRNSSAAARADGPFGPKIERGRRHFFPQIAGRGFEIQATSDFATKNSWQPLDISAESATVLGDLIASPPIQSRCPVRPIDSIASVSSSIERTAGVLPRGKLRTADAFEKIKPAGLAEGCCG